MQVRKPDAAIGKKAALYKGLDIVRVIYLGLEYSITIEKAVRRDSQTVDITALR